MLQYRGPVNNRRVSGIVTALAVKLWVEYLVGGLAEGHSGSMKMGKERQEGYLKSPYRKLYQQGMC